MALVGVTHQVRWCRDTTGRLAVLLERKGETVKLKRLVRAYQLAGLGVRQREHKRLDFTSWAFWRGPSDYTAVAAFVEGCLSTAVLTLEN